MKAYHKKSTSKYKDELNVDYQYGIQDVLNAIVQKTKKKDDLSKVEFHNRILVTSNNRRR